MVVTDCGGGGCEFWASSIVYVVILTINMSIVLNSIWSKSGVSVEKIKNALQLHKSYALKLNKPMLSIYQKIIKKVKWILKALMPIIFSSPG